MNYAAALPHPVHTQAVAHLLRADRQEDLCFALWFPSRGTSRTTALLERLVLPGCNDRRVHGNVSFLPQYFERAIGEAVNAGAGLALMHSHLGPGWQDMSPDDMRAEEQHAPAVSGATGFPFLGLTVGTDEAWSARFWVKTGPRHYRRQWCSSTRVVGQRLALTYHDGLVARPTFRPELSRTVSAWGPAAQLRLARLRVGIVGAGSVGFLVAEALARMGISCIRLFDFDRIETVNLDRLLYATKEHARLRLPKVDVLADALRRGATADPFSVEPLQWSIVEDEGFRAALDCDVLFSCVDRPWPRSVLNFIAYAHLIPVIDGGIGIVTKPGNAGLRGADWRAHIAAPTRPCLECLGQYDAGDVSTERDGYFDDPVYIQGLSPDHPIKRNENVFAFSMSVASFEVLQMLSMVIAPLGISNPGSQMYHFVTGQLDCDDTRTCNENCLYRSFTAKGDHSGISVTGGHHAAERARATVTPSRRPWREFFRRFWPSW